MCSHLNRLDKAILMSTLNLPFFKYKKENNPKLSQICNYGICSKGLKNEFDTSVVNGPSNHCSSSVYDNKMLPLYTFWGYEMTI